MLIQYCFEIIKMQLRLSSCLKYLLVVYGSTKLARWLVDYIVNLYTYRNHRHLPMYPLIGNLHLVHSANVSRLQRVFNWSRQFSDAPMFVFWNTWRPIVMIHKAEPLEVSMTIEKLQCDLSLKFFKL